MGEPAGQLPGADVPGDVLPAGQLGQAQAVQGRRKGPAGVVADDERRGLAVFLQHDERRRVVAADQRDGGGEVGVRGRHAGRSLHGASAPGLRLRRHLPACGRPLPQAGEGAEG